MYFSPPGCSLYSASTHGTLERRDFCRASPADRCSLVCRSSWRSSRPTSKSACIIINVLRWIIARICLQRSWPTELLHSDRLLQWHPVRFHRRLVSTVHRQSDCHERASRHILGAILVLPGIAAISAQFATAAAGGKVVAVLPQCEGDGRDPWRPSAGRVRETESDCQAKRFAAASEGGRFRWEMNWSWMLMENNESCGMCP